MDTRLLEENFASRSASVPIRPTEDDARAQVQNSPGEFAEEYPAYCRLLQDIPDIPRYKVGKDSLNHMPAGNQDSGWQNCLNSVEKYDRELCQAYREQIDTLLVFAGLFSAVVTAFAVESYQWLQDDPIDPSVDLLRNVVGLLSQNLNLTVPPTSTPSQRLSGPVVTRINSFWFLSLSLSLSAALVGILCKQWLREFERNVGQSPEKALAVRYIRYQGLEFWKVGSIVTSVPIIMQAALAFFMVGVIELLWRLNTVVACCVTGTAGLTLAFYLVTTLLPVVQYACICTRCYLKPLRTRDYPSIQAFTEPQCAFKSAQAWLAFRIAEPIINRLLQASGYQFSAGRPPAFFERILRPADSWVDFDLNWIKCRDDVHTGPQCSFECLAWIAGNLGEMHMSSWIWHCVWERWMKARYQSDALRVANSDIESVARSYPSIVALDNSNAPLVRSQALLFRCSLRTDLPVNMALELLLGVADAVGATSRWTHEALNAVRVLYHGLSIHLNDGTLKRAAFCGCAVFEKVSDIARGLFRLAEFQTQAILLESDSAARVNGALGFTEIFAMLRTGSRMHSIFMPAMCGLALQWMRSNPPESIAEMALLLFEDTIVYLESRGYRGAALNQLRQCRGIMFIAKLAGVVAERWPYYPREAYLRSRDHRAILLALLDMLSAGFPELSPGHSDGALGPLPGTVRGAEEERSSTPAPDIPDVGDEAQPEPPGPLGHGKEETLPPPREHVGIDVHEDAGPGHCGIARNGPASPVVAPTIPASPRANSV